MTCDLTSMELTPAQKSQVCSVLAVGCDRQTAVDYVGCSLAELRRALVADRSFLALVRRTEASIELTHMNNVKKAADSQKAWRASVWWLERRSPERYARRADSVTPGQLRAFVELVGDVLDETVRDADDRRHVLARLAELAQSAERMTRAVRDGLADSADVSMSLAEEAAEEGANDAPELDATVFEGEDEA